MSIDLYIFQGGHYTGIEAFHSRQKTKTKTHGTKIALCPDMVHLGMKLVGR